MKKLVFLCAALLLAAGPSSAAEIHGKKLKLVSARSSYVPSEQFNSVQFAPPPAADSDVQKADVAAVQYWEAHSTDADCERANKTFFVPFAYMWGETSPFPQPLPTEVQSFFDRIDSDTGAAAKVMKSRYQRPRPALTNPCPGSNGGGYSYPSSHAALSRVFADVLADLVPARKAEFIAKADGIAQDRVIIGVHYPSDIAAGKDFADLFHADLLKSEGYRKDLEKMKSFLVK